MADFAMKYLSHHFSTPFGEHHLDLFDALESGKKGKRVARAEPRLHGKSTIMIVLAPLYYLAYKLKYFILLLGSSDGAISPHYQALQSEMDPITGNRALLHDFPHLQPAMDFKGQFVSWTDHKMVNQQGQTVNCYGYYSKYRGLKQKQHRPDLIIIDDPQDEEDISTFKRRQKYMGRLRKTILNLGGADCDIFVEGNFMHEEGMIAQLLLDDAWDGKMYIAENLPHEKYAPFPIGNSKQDGSPLWPEEWSSERLAQRRIEIKDNAYSIEFLNKRRADGSKIYETSSFQRYKRADFKLSDKYQVVASWDPADAERDAEGDTCFASISVAATRLITTGKVQLRYYWLLENWLQVATPETQVDAALDLTVKWPITRFFYEDNGGFGTLIPYIKTRARERGITIPLRRINQHKNKIQRISNASPVIYHRFFFPDDISPIYLSQWDEFPDGKIDGPDSTVSIILEYEKPRGGMIIG